MQSQNWCKGPLTEILKAHGLDEGMLAEILIEASANACVVAANDGLVLFANDHAGKRLGILPGSRLTDAVPEILQRVKRLQAGAGEEPSGAVLKRGKDTYLARLTLVRSGKTIIGTFCVFVGLTVSEANLGEMKVYAELTRAQDALLNSLSEGLWICDREANLLFLNPPAERINFLKAEEVLGHNLQDMVPVANEAT